MATQSLKAAVPAPVRDGVAIVLDALHIRKRYVSEPQGFDPKTGLIEIKPHASLDDLAGSLIHEPLQHVMAINDPV